MTQQFLFLDTTTFLEFVPLNQIDWAERVGAQPIILVIAPVIIRELNKHKDSPQSERKREQAAKALRLLNSFLDQTPPALSGGIEVKLLSRDALIDFHDHELSRQVSDDHLLASLIDHQYEHPGCQHHLVTEDVGLRIKARSKQIPYIGLPDRYRRPTESSSSEKEIRRLRAEVERLKTRIPDLKLLYRDGSDRTNLQIPSPNLPPLPQPKSLAVIRSENSYTPPPGSPRAFLVGADVTRFGISAESIKRYNDQLDVFFERYAEYEKQFAEFKRFRLLSGELRLQLVNEGTSHADDLDLYLYPDTKARFFVAHEVPGEPSRPVAPRHPLSTFQLAVADHQSKVKGWYTTSEGNEAGSNPATEVFVPENVGEFIIESDEDYQRVKLGIRKAKHRHAQFLEPLVFAFESSEDVRSFTIDYEIHAANLSEPAEGKLHVIIATADSSNAESAID